MENAKIKSYKDLIVWQKGYELVKQVYQITSTLPHLALSDFNHKCVEHLFL